MLDSTLAILGVIGGFTLSVLASRKAVDNTAELAAGTNIPPFVVGFTLLALGTDLPEIANSIVSSLAGHGDLNVGDSVGSAATQATLVLGLLPFVGGAAIMLSKTRVLRIGIATVFALLLGAGLMLDGEISRIDAMIFIAAWAIATAFTWGPPPEGTQMELSLEATEKLKKTLVVLLALAVVGGATLLAVWGLTTLAEAINVPEFIVAFFLASLGTSLPELVVATTAMRRHQTELAVGDALGATLIDSTLSIGIGPLIAPIVVTTSLVVPGSILTAGAVGIVALVLSIRGNHDWRSGVAFVLIYPALYLVLLNI
ncbi:MAG: hypothetical protein U9N56_00935 [Actinomycetota bacterium]|nr:hypothetical protein [Actinomycetota bacterium]